MKCPWPIVVLALAAACGGREDRRPNVLLVSIDTLRADHLSAYGHWRPTSPNLDRLAANGVLFEECFAPTSWTLPSHLSMLTGLSMSVHGIDDERLWQVVGVPGGPPVLPMKGTFLSEVFQKAGYRTAGFVTWKFLEPRFGFGPGFEVYERVSDIELLDGDSEARLQREARAREGTGQVAQLATERPEWFAAQGPTADLVVRRASAWLDGLQADDNRAPWLLFAHIFDPHDDYRAPEPFLHRFTKADYEGPIDGRGVTADGPVRPGMDERDLAQLVAYYDGEIAWTDDRVGALIADVERRGALENTIVVVTSDHGEEFFEHGAKQHRAQLYAESLHVPLIVAWPRGLPAGRRVPGLVGLVDLAPTLYSLADVPAPPHLSGRDLSPAARGDAELDERSYSAVLHSFPRREWTPNRLVALRRGSQSMIQHLPRDGARRVEYFDRSVNPREVGHGEELFEGDARLVELDGELERLRASYRRARAALPLRGGPSRALDRGELAELSSMGYAEAPAVEEGAAVRAHLDRLVLDGGIWPDLR